MTRSERSGRGASPGSMRSPESPKILPPWQIRRVTDWVGAHMDDPVAIADLAGLVNLSPSHFPRMFLPTPGMTPHRWLPTCRIHSPKPLFNGSLPLSRLPSHAAL